MSEEKINRLRRGATLEHVYTPTDVHFGHIDSAFQSQEYIAQLIRQDPHDVQKIVAPPKQSDDDKGSVDDGCWLYEQLRRLAQDLTYPLITNLQLECNRDTCPEMKAGEWLYLCVAHGNAPGGHVQCCAIDYIVHTLDSATALLNSTRVFPSRLSVPQSSYRHFSSLARRLSRIFAHAFYHHRELFSQAEAESSLYARFLALSQQHDLVPAELLVIPSEGFETGASSDRNHETDHRRDPGSPQTAIDTGEEGTYLPNESEKNAARRLFEEWTGNKGQEPGEGDDEPDEPDAGEGAEGHTNEPAANEPATNEPAANEPAAAEQEPDAPTTEAHDAPDKGPEIQAPTSEDSHVEASEPQAQAAPEPEPASKTEDKEDKTEPASAPKPTEGDERPSSPAKEADAPQQEKDNTQPKDDSSPEKPKDDA